MKKTTKQFVITSEAKNLLGFRVRTSGINLTDFNLNPLLLWMHKRPKGESKDEVLPIGNVVDIELKDGKLYGRLAFDESDPFAMTLYHKYENGTLRALSAGLLPLEWSEDTTGDPWLEKSSLKEISCCDIGSNSEAVTVALYDDSDKIINLSLDNIQNLIKPDNTMTKVITLNAPNILPLLTLAEGATAEEVQAAIGNLVTLAATQKTQIGTLTTERDDFKTKYEAEVKLRDESKIITLLDDGEAKGKFVKADRPKWQKLAEANFDGTKDVLDAMPVSKSVASQVTTAGADDSLLSLSYDELDKNGKLVTLKAENLPAFKEKFKAKFGKEYKEKA